MVVGVRGGARALNLKKKIHLQLTTGSGGCGIDITQARHGCGSDTHRQAAHGTPQPHCAPPTCCAPPPPVLAVAVALLRRAALHAALRLCGGQSDTRADALLQSARRQLLTFPRRRTPSAITSPSHPDPANPSPLLPSSSSRLQIPAIVYLADGEECRCLQVRRREPAAAPRPHVLPANIIRPLTFSQSQGAAKCDRRRPHCPHDADPRGLERARRLWRAQDRHALRLVSSSSLAHHAVL